jgi:cysteine protease avirulence protein AvrRpt2
MAKNVKLVVPLVKQDRSMECWYAAACMVRYYFEAGPRLGVPKAWADNKGLPMADFATLAKNEHLVSVPFPSNRQWSQDDLAVVLETKGPIWAWGMWDGVSHIVVLTGVEDGNIHYNDPSGPKRRTMSLAHFNAKLIRNYPSGSPSLMVAAARSK